MNRRTFVAHLTVFGLAPSGVLAVTRDIWSAPEAAAAINTNAISLVDVRSRGEWEDTGVAQGAWPISLHEQGFETRLFAARALSAEKPVALICATGGRSGRVLSALKGAGYSGFIDVSEGMLGSSRGPGWIARGLPIHELETALAMLPDALR